MFQTNNKIIIKLISIYTITMSFLTLIMSAKVLFIKFNDLSSYNLTLIILIIYTMLLLVYTNINLLINKNQIIFSYRFNIVVSFLQIFHFQILGITLHFIAMSDLSVYIISNNNLDFKFFASIYEGALELLYRRDLNGFFFGINFIPMFVYIMYLKSYKTYQKNINISKDIHL